MRRRQGRERRTMVTSDEFPDSESSAAQQRPKKREPSGGNLEEQPNGERHLPFWDSKRRNKAIKLVDQ